MSKTRNDEFLVQRIFHVMQYHGMFVNLRVLCLVARIDVDKLQKLGIPPGPLYSRIKKGEAVTAPNGLTVGFESITLARECIEFTLLITGLIWLLRTQSRLRKCTG